MFNSESDDYQLENDEKLIIEDLYQNGVLIGYKKTIKQPSGYYRELTYNANNQILSDMKYFGKNQLISGKTYQDGKIAQYIETDTDSSGFRHEVVMDANYKTISHSKFDKFGRYAGGIIYENHKIIGQKELNYSENGDIIEIVRDEKYHIVLERKLKTNHNNSDKTVPNTNSVIIEQHEIKIDDKGAKHKIVYDANNQIISDTEMPLMPPVAPKPITPKKTPPKSEKTTLKGKIVVLLLQIFSRHK